MAAQDILDRVGYKSPEKVELNTTVGEAEEETLRHMSDEKLAKLKAASASLPRWCPGRTDRSSPVDRTE